MLLAHVALDSFTEAFEGRVSARIKIIAGRKLFLLFAESQVAYLCEFCGVLGTVLERYNFASVNQWLLSADVFLISLR